MVTQSYKLIVINDCIYSKFLREKKSKKINKIWALISNDIKKKKTVLDYLLLFSKIFSRHITKQQLIISILTNIREWLLKDES